MVNVYGPNGGFNSLVTVTDLQNNNQIHQPYWDPPSFAPSSYSPYNIISNNNPTGSNGPLSEDSFIAKLGAERLKFAFEERVSAEIYQNTVGVLNLQALKDPFEASLLVSGKEKLIQKNYKITVPNNPITRALSLATSLTGAYWPVSPIPGSYFENVPKNGQQGEQTSGALNVLNRLTGGFLGPILDIKSNPSDLFLENTGNGQRSILFNNLDYNRYQPSYDRNFGGILGAAQNIIQTALQLLDLAATPGGYYVGSRNSEPSTITSPPNQIPVDPFGRQVQTPVYGPSELGTLYEGNIGKLEFTLPAIPSIEGGGVSSAFVWTSPKTKGGAGYKATIGGGIGDIDGEYNQISSTYTKGESTNIEFKQSSILDQTQRLIDSADNVSGISKLKHVGNAINQVSKVFNDGYQEMTKGSQVIRYKDNTDGTEVGTEYCRVFQKDTPYYTYNDLQKSAGITKEGRRFSYSVLDSTYNLNIAPLRGENSTNIVKNAKGERYAKKYMFSLENLAWRTSSRPDFRYDDLPDCEKGPNGGRVMWFPPYDLSFNDSSTADWNPTQFIGRPEPIYTYKQTSRTGSLSWRIVVDSPSVMNVLIDKQLKGVDSKKVDSILESFFAGCVKYDIYELAKKFNTFKASELQELQEIITQPNLTREEIEGVLSQLPVQNIPGNSSSGISNPQGPPETITTSNIITEFETKYQNFGFYFEDDVPGPGAETTTSLVYDDLFKTYTRNGNITFYQKEANAQFKPNSPQRDTTSFFRNIIISNWETFTVGENSFVKQAEKILADGNEITVIMRGSASALGAVAYNKRLSERRINSVLNYFRLKTPLKKYIDGATPTFKIISSTASGEQTIVPISESGAGEPINCTENIKNKSGEVTSNSQKYSRNAMACRRVRVETIRIVKKVTETTTETTIPQQPVITPGVDDPDIVIPSKPEPIIDVRKKLKDGIGKRILRRLLSECDYFDVLQNENPFVYDSIKQKLKYFNPIFHSMTPEGLNSRLTFLNQCVRPGETIPVIGVDGKPKYNDALNTSFGTPPILVLRIGDFYHTKIVPKSLQITYDPLLYDMNPEGIGLQPMIAKVTLSFDFIGGHGLARPVEQLQNALSFNYYANTEIYDERAVWTEDTSVFDQELFNSIFEGEKPITVEDAVTTPERKGGNTIGDILTTVPITGGETGFTTYQKIMDTTLDISKQYFTGVLNLAEKIIKQNNLGIWQLLVTQRGFSTGSALLYQQGSTPTPIALPIFGKPIEVDTRLQFLGEKVLSDINVGFENYIMKNMLALNTFKPTDLEQLRINLSDYVSSQIISLSAPIFDAIQTFTIFQQDMVQNFRKLNVVNSSTDGKILDNGLPFIYTVDGTNEVYQKESNPIRSTLEELKKDYETLALQYFKYDTYMKEQSVITELYPKTKIGAGKFKPVQTQLLSNDFDKAFFMVIARVFSDVNKFLEFKQSLLTNGLKDVPKFEIKLNQICEDFKKIVDTELASEEKLFADIRLKQDFINYEKKDSYPPGKTRKLQYTTVPNQQTETEQKKLVKDVWADINVDSDNKKWDGKVKFN